MVPNPSYLQYALVDLLIAAAAVLRPRQDSPATPHAHVSYRSEQGQGRDSNRWNSAGSFLCGSLMHSRTTVFDHKAPSWFLGPISDVKASLTKALSVEQSSRDGANGQQESFRVEEARLDVTAHFLVLPLLPH